MHLNDDTPSSYSFENIILILAAIKPVEKNVQIVNENVDHQFVKYQFCIRLDITFK